MGTIQYIKAYLQKITSPCTNVVLQEVPTAITEYDISGVKVIYCLDSKFTSRFISIGLYWSAV